MGYSVCVCVKFIQVCGEFALPLPTHDPTVTTSYLLAMS